MNNNENNHVLYSVHYVKEVFFIIREHLIGTESGKEVLVQMIGQTGYNLEQNILNFSLKVWYHFRDEVDELAAIEVQNTFNIPNLAKYVNSDSKIQLPPLTWAQIIGISISHVRALFTKNLSGTALQSVIIPVMNPLEVAQQFFPESFEIEVKENKAETPEITEVATKPLVKKRAGR